MKKEQKAIQIVDPKMITAAVEKSMPKWVAKIKDKEDMANAMYASSQEMWIAVLDVLVRYHGFKEDEIKRFNEEAKDILTGAKEFEKDGLSMLSPHSMGIIGDKVEEIGIEGLLVEIAEIRNRKEKLTRIGMEVPVLPAATPFLKKLKQKNEGR